MTAPRRLFPGDPCLRDVLDLIRRSFAFMEGRIDPPSSMHRLSLAALQEQCRHGEIWAIGTPPAACVFLTPHPDCLYLGKLAVDGNHRGTGLARALVKLAATRAAALGLQVLRLQARIELTENHTAFARMGFRKTGETAHTGFAKPTSVTMERAVPGSRAQN
ncbi:GNAT family acetyltransferase [Leisingera sp. ANG-M7]|uniref:GNAT family N-acetyltransferase n=1 Tax=Leisingera sp. ANG-M7 TaxID=1577902 RepID=UPI00057E9329|nr:GNAT family N-acetyltransferase [Leisingera sp. ANG-M7]KIC32158.1 GNAT family acetyltransferase [Leisingera sp. ANG-M7]